MPAGKQRAVKPGWEHRAFLGKGPFEDEEFASKLAEAATANGWSDAEAKARAAQAYETHAYEVADVPAPADVKEE